MNLLTILLGVFSGTGIVQFLIALLIIAIIVYALKVLLDWVFPPASIPQPVRILFWLIVVVVVVLYLVNRFAGSI